MLLQLCTWQEVEAYLRRSTGVILPIGSTEQHGPNGLIGTDAICPEIIAQAVGEQEDAMVAPTITVGMAQHHMAFTGTITLRPSTLIAYINDVVNSLARHGFNRFYFLNGHGGNIATVTASFSELYAEASLRTTSHNRPAIRCKLANWFDGKGVKAISKELFGDSEGSHATPSEVSLSYYARPEAVKTATMSPKVAPKGSFTDSDDYRRRFPDGRIGSDPTLASVAHGERLYKAGVEDVAADYRAFLKAE